jgi:hypothetical protein
VAAILVEVLVAILDEADILVVETGKVKSNKSTGDMGSSVQNGQKGVFYMDPVPNRAL